MLNYNIQQSNQARAIPASQGHQVPVGVMGRHPGGAIQTSAGV